MSRSSQLSSHDFRILAACGGPGAGAHWLHQLLRDRPLLNANHVLVFDDASVATEYDKVFENGGISGRIRQEQTALHGNEQLASAMASRTRPRALFFIGGFEEENSGLTARNPTTAGSPSFRRWWKSCQVTSTSLLT